MLVKRINDSEITQSNFDFNTDAYFQTNYLNSYYSWTNCPCVTYTGSFSLYVNRSKWNNRWMVFNVILLPVPLRTRPLSDWQLSKTVLCRLNFPGIKPTKRTQAIQRQQGLFVSENSVQNQQAQLRNNGKNCLSNRIDDKTQDPQWMF